MFAALPGGCALVAPGGPAARLDVSFRSERTIGRGEAVEVASWATPGRVKLGGAFVRLSGTLDLPAGSRRPRKLVVTAEVLESGSGKREERIRAQLDVRRESTFRKIKRLGNRWRPGALVVVTLEPKGAPLPAGTGYRFCVDLAETSAELAASVSCAAAGNAATLAGIQERIFTPTCARSGCHDADTASAALVLEEGAAYEHLVGVPSSQVFGFDRVEPGKPETSYLIKKIRGSSDIMGVRMPLGGPFLDDGEIAGIYEWIETGARESP